MITISFVIPIYNEEKRLYKTFKALRQAQGKLFGGLKLEKVIFVDDGSTDRSKLIVESGKLKVKKAVKLISYHPNKGKGYAVKRGMMESDSDYTLFFDADISTPLSELNKFIKYFENKIDVIVGTRKNGKSTVVRHQPLFREFLGRGFTLLTQIILRLNISDFTCGFKAFSRQSKEKIFSEAKIQKWGYDAEILYIAKKFGFSIAEKSVIWANDERTKVNLLKDIPYTLFELGKINWIHAIKPEIIYTFNYSRLNYKKFTKTVASLLSMIF